jgi:hypothetical protein
MFLGGKLGGTFQKEKQMTYQRRSLAIAISLLLLLLAAVWQPVTAAQRGRWSDERRCRRVCNVTYNRCLRDARGERGRRGRQRACYARYQACLRRC